MTSLTLVMVHMKTCDNSFGQRDSIYSNIGRADQLYNPPPPNLDHNVFVAAYTFHLISANPVEEQGVSMQEELFLHHTWLRFSGI